MSATASLKRTIYRVARFLGMFVLARRLTRNQLRILAYHGFASGDELAFRPKLFISLSTFSSRMELIARRGFDVVKLDDAVRRLRSGDSLRNMLVITIDDGYASTRDAARILKRHGFAATVYVTTYHVEQQTPVFDLVVGYMFWRCGLPQIALTWPAQSEPRILPVQGDAAREHSLREVIALGRQCGSEDDRVELCRVLGHATGVDYEEILRRDSFRLMTPEDLSALAADAVSVGLHTHRHRFPPADLAVCRSELLENESRLLRWTPVPGRHFCYPSGVYDHGQWNLLESMGIGSSTTCETGLVGKGTPPHGLPRFLDGEMVDEVEFDAELCGFAELLRRSLGALRARRQS